MCILPQQKKEQRKMIYIAFFYIFKIEYNNFLKNETSFKNIKYPYI